MNMNYYCRNPKAKYIKDQVWEGEIRNLKRRGSIIEGVILGRGSSMYIIIGEYEYGNFLCIPNRQVGSELACLSDIYWNQEHLALQIGRVDAITVAEALKRISKELECMV
ncbi:hypothetical protein LJC58_01335 [Lachnospiraceae bacterium OttesenSCG-928-D06]|nr:hypothetical protein [Lachnospiraceae bacterium OttesenSCG-928-D06]